MLYSKAKDMDSGRDMRVGAAAALVALAIVAAFTQKANAQGSIERPNRGVVEIITGNSESTDLRIAEDLASVLDDGATRRIIPLVGKGSMQNITDVRALRGVDLGIIQTDVLGAAKTQGKHPGLENSITYVTKLYSQEFHLLAREPISRISDLQGKKVNFDVPGSGTSVTGPLVFQRLKIAVNGVSYDPALAVEKLKSGEIAAIAFVAAKPAPFFVNLPPDSGFRLIAVPVAGDLMTDYFPASLTPDDYPGLVQQPLETIAVSTILAVANLVPGGERYRNVVNFVDTFFTQFSRFQEPPRHPKWREVNLSAGVPGWRRFPAAETWLKNNAAPAPALDDPRLREMFVRFLDQRSRSARGVLLSQQQKDEMFEQFRKWQAAQRP
jgi:TRAP-type uncharacterized transport system substrate-binding protein